MRILLAVIGLITGLVPAAAQAQAPTQQQIEAFAARTMSIALTIDMARRCDVLDPVERVLAGKLLESDIGDLRRVYPQADSWMAGNMARLGGKPCGDPQLQPALAQGRGYIASVASAGAQVIDRVKQCGAIVTYDSAKPWAARRVHATTAAVPQMVSGMTAALENHANNQCARVSDTSSPLAHVAYAATVIKEEAELGLPECWRIGTSGGYPVCAFREPGASGLVAAARCDLTTGSFDRGRCLLGFDKAGNLLLTFELKTSTAVPEVLEGAAIWIGGQRHVTKERLSNPAQPQLRTFRFAPAVAQALLAAPRDATVKIQLDVKVVDKVVTKESITTPPAGDLQDAVKLAKVTG